MGCFANSVGLYACFFLLERTFLHPERSFRVPVFSGFETIFSELNKIVPGHVSELQMVVSIALIVLDHFVNVFCTTLS